MRPKLRSPGLTKREIESWKAQVAKNSEIEIWMGNLPSRLLMYGDQWISISMYCQKSNLCLHWKGNPSYNLCHGHLYPSLFFFLLSGFFWGGGWARTLVLASVPSSYRQMITWVVWKLNVNHNFCFHNWLRESRNFKKYAW